MQITRRLATKLGVAGKNADGHPERSLARLLRQTESRDLHLPLRRANSLCKLPWRRAYVDTDQSVLHKWLCRS